MKFWIFLNRSIHRIASPKNIYLKCLVRSSKYTTRFWLRLWHFWLSRLQVLSCQTDLLLSIMTGEKKSDFIEISARLQRSAYNLGLATQPYCSHHVLYILRFRRKQGFQESVRVWQFNWELRYGDTWSLIEYHHQFELLISWAIYANSQLLLTIMNTEIRERSICGTYLRSIHSSLSPFDTFVSDIDWLVDIWRYARLRPPHTSGSHNANSVLLANYQALRQHSLPLAMPQCSHVQ